MCVCVYVCVMCTWYVSCSKLNYVVLDVIVTPSSTISPSTPTLVVTTGTVIVADGTPSVTDTSSVTATPDTIPSVTGTPVIPDVTAEAPDSQTNDNDLSGGEIAAIVIGSVFGAVIVLVVIAAIAYWYALCNAQEIILFGIIYRAS